MSSFRPRCALPWLVIVAAAQVGGALAADPLTVNLSPTADAFVDSFYPDSNFGGAGALAIAAPGAPKGEFQSVLKFDAASAKAAFDAAFGPSLWSIQGVMLALTAANPKNSLFNSQSAGQLAISWLNDDSWLEGSGTPSSPGTTGVSFNALPSLRSAGEQGLGTFSFAGATSGTTDYPLASAASLLSDVAAGDFVSLRLAAADSNIAYVLNSHEYSTAAFRPTLLITAAPMSLPEPSSIILLLLGGGVLLGLKSSRQIRSLLFS